MASRRLLSAVLAAVVFVPLVASADDYDRKLASYEAEAKELGTNLPQIGKVTLASNQRRLVDAQVAFSLGDYDTASLMLFELAATPGPEQETARFYLAESLLNKRDRGAARSYYQLIVDGNNPSSKYYAPSVMRILEIAIAQADTEDLTAELAALDRVGTSDEGTYVRGKLAFAQNNYDDAIARFNGVPQGSEHELQATYYSATAYVAKNDLPRATGLFLQLINAKPKSAGDRRVIELSQMALGRLYYEQDQLAKSIDSYLLVDRHSDLFPDALYEVAWVYVKTKQYDKALRALELLALTEPDSKKTPTVRILEGNLRIRKAQLLRQRIVEGTIKPDDEDAATSPEQEYEKATTTFIETHDAYYSSYVALDEIINSNADPAQYLAQIAGRTPEVFQTTAPLPEAAAEYLADAPGVQRAVRIESDLGEIRSALASAETTLARLEVVVGANDRTVVYPILNSRRLRVGTLQDELTKVRGELADQELALVDSPGDLPSLTTTRRALMAQYNSRPTVENAYAARVEEAQRGVSALEETVGEVSSALDTTQAMAVAIRTYSASMGANPDTALTAEQTAAVTDTLNETASESAAITAELAALQRELELGRDLAAYGDADIAQSRDVRKQLLAAMGTEHRVLAGLVGASRDQGRSKRLSELSEKAQRISDQLASLEMTIDGMADRGLADARAQIAQEQGLIKTYRAELVEREAESRELGATVLGRTFADVKAKFYDIVVRTDVGVVDVAWSKKEDNTDDVKRLNLSRQRELKQLRDEFKGILDEHTSTPANQDAPPAPGPDQPPPPPAPGAPVVPGTSPAPTVRPGQQ